MVTITSRESEAKIRRKVTVFKVRPLIQKQWVQNQSPEKIFAGLSMLDVNVQITREYKA